MKRRSSGLIYQERCVSPTIKRGKVQAQRKFAQGSNNYNYSTTKIVPKTPDNVFPPFQLAQQDSPETEECELNNFASLPTVDDFLTFLCFRETDILPERLNYLNNPQFDNSSIDQKCTSLNNAIPNQITNSQNNEQSCKETTSKNNLKKKLPEFKLRSHHLSSKTIIPKASKHSLALKHNQRLRSKNISESKLVLHTQKKQIQQNNQLIPKSKKSSPSDQELNENGSRPSTRASNSSGSSPVKSTDFSDRVTRRSSSLIKIPENVVEKTSTKEDVEKVLMNSNNPIKLLQKPKTSAVKSNVVYGNIPPKLATRNSLSNGDQRETTPNRNTRSNSVLLDEPRSNTRLSGLQADEASKKKCSDKEYSSENIKEKISPYKSTRPWRRTKAAAALYMEMLGKELLDPDNEEDDDVSVDNFPELPSAEPHLKLDKELKELHQKKKFVKGCARKSTTPVFKPLLKFNKHKTTKKLDKKVKKSTEKKTLRKQAAAICPGENECEPKKKLKNNVAAFKIKKNPPSPWIDSIPEQSKKNNEKNKKNSGSVSNQLVNSSKKIPILRPPKRSISVVEENLITNEKRKKPIVFYSDETSDDDMDVDFLGFPIMTDDNEKNQKLLENSVKTPKTNVRTKKIIKELLGNSTLKETEASTITKNQIVKDLLKDESEISPPMTLNSEVESKKMHEVKKDLVKKEIKRSSSVVKETEFKQIVDADMKTEKKTAQILKTRVLEKSTSKTKSLPERTVQHPPKEIVKRVISLDTEIEESEKSTPSKSTSLSSSSPDFVSKDVSKSLDGEKKIFKKSNSFSSVEGDRKSEPFSADNENSVYAFEPDLPTTSPPFRRLKSLTPTKPAMPNSIAVQVSFPNNVELEGSSSGDTKVSSTTDCGDQVFYIPIPTTTVTSTLGVAVKLGTDGPNQKIIMSATLITNSSTFTTNTASNVVDKTCTVETVCANTNSIKLSCTEQKLNSSSSVLAEDQNTVKIDESLDETTTFTSPTKKIHPKIQSVKILKLNKKKKNPLESKNQKEKETILGKVISTSSCSSDVLISSTPVRSKTVLDSKKMILSPELITSSQSSLTTSKDFNYQAEKSSFLRFGKIQENLDSSKLTNKVNNSLEDDRKSDKTEHRNAEVKDTSFKRRRSLLISSDNVLDISSKTLTSSKLASEGLKKSVPLTSSASNWASTSKYTSKGGSSGLTAEKHSNSCSNVFGEEVIPSNPITPDTNCTAEQVVRLKDSSEPVTIMKMTKNKKKDSKAVNSKNKTVEKDIKIEKNKKSELDVKNWESVLEETKLSSELGKVLEAPTFHPTEEEFNDPLEYIDKIRNTAEKFGLCRIIPPSNFRPECKVNDGMRFTAYNQYVHKMLHRWGPNVKEMMVIRRFLATQNIQLTQPPRIGGMEVDLPRLYQVVQQCGGLRAVMEEEKWHVVADAMKIPKLAQDRITKLDDIYCKYLLPYDILSHEEREKLFEEVETEWTTHLENARDEDNELFEDIHECITKGRTMALSCFYRMARNTMLMCFGNMEGGESPSTESIEQEFWKHVSDRNCHICVHSGSVDSGSEGFGFSISKNSTCKKHPWNLKVLTNNSASVLRSLGPVMGVTVPTLHFGMLYSTCCWYRDPHGLPWIEYLHTGANKIWYGVADELSEQFRYAMLKLVPRYCLDKKIWLPSDTVMIPPPLLTAHNVSLSRVVQEPGQFIVVFPKAFTSSVSTGYLVSEIVYFANASWLDSAKQIFKDMQDSGEPPVFPLEQLLICIAQDARTSLSILNKILPLLVEMREIEVASRKVLKERGITSNERLHVNKKRKSKTTTQEEDYYECDTCHTNLFLSMVEDSQEQCNYCLKHAASLLQKKSTMAKYCKLLYSYSEDELDDLIEKVNGKIETKSSKKSLSK